VRDADVILAMDKGKVVELGRHAELMEKRGSYYQLVSLQELEESQGATRSAHAFPGCLGAWAQFTFGKVIFIQSNPNGKPHPGGHRQPSLQPASALRKPTRGATIDLRRLVVVSLYLRPAPTSRSTVHADGKEHAMNKRRNVTLIAGVVSAAALLLGSRATSAQSDEAEFHLEYSSSGAASAYQELRPGSCTSDGTSIFCSGSSVQNVTYSGDIVGTGINLVQWNWFSGNPDIVKFAVNEQVTGTVKGCGTGVFYVAGTGTNHFATTYVMGGNDMLGPGGGDLETLSGSGTFAGHAYPDHSFEDHVSVSVKCHHALQH
jgi:hypothetical protein